MLHPARVLEFSQRFQSPRETFAGDVLEVAIQGVFGWNLKMRKRIFHLFQPQVAALGDSQGPRQDVGRIFEDAVHLVVVLDVETRSLKLHPVRFLNALPRLNADHHVLRMGVVFAEIMAVIRGHQRQAQIFFQPKESGMDMVLPFQTLILNFQKEIFFAKDVAVIRRGLARGIVLVFHQALGDFAFQTTGEPDQSS